MSTFLINNRDYTCVLSLSSLIFFHFISTSTSLSFSFHSPQSPAIVKPRWPDFWQFSKKKKKMSSQHEDCSLWFFFFFHFPKSIFCHMRSVLYGWILSKSSIQPTNSFDIDSIKNRIGHNAVATVHRKWIKNSLFISECLAMCWQVYIQGWWWVTQLRNIPLLCLCQETLPHMDHSKRSHNLRIWNNIQVQSILDMYGDFCCFIIFRDTD